MRAVSKLPQISISVTKDCANPSYSPDGKRLASASEDKTAQIYALDIRELLDLARSRVTRTPPSLTPDECKRYFQSETCRLCPETVLHRLRDQCGDNFNARRSGKKNTNKP